MRNYDAMNDAKLLRCLTELRDCSGAAYERCVAKGGDPANDLREAEDLVRGRGFLLPGADDDWDQIRDARVHQLTADGLEPAAALLGDNARPCIALKHSGQARGRSRLAGEPDLPAELDWPQYHDTNMAFVLQVDLTDLPDLARERGLPDAGLLSLFYADDDDAWGEFPEQHGSGRLLYFPPEAPLARRPVPSSMSEYSDFTERPLTSELDVTFPDFYALAGDEDGEKLYERGRTHPHPAHQLFGHAYAIQNDPIDEAPTKRTSAKPPTGVPDIRTDRASDWVLLLQVDTDDDAGFMWGDAGTLYVCVSKADLAAGRFDRAWVSMQCS